MAFEPYKFNDSAANQAPLKLSKQFAKRILKRAAAERKDPSSLQNRVNARLDEAAKNAAAINKANAKNAATADKASAKAAADKKAKAAATRRATAAHKVRLSRATELEDLKTQKQVERVKALAEAKAGAATATPQKKPAAAKAPNVSAARKTPSGISTDKDGVLKPIVSKSKDAKPSGSRTPKAKLNTSAGEAYND